MSDWLYTKKTKKSLQTWFYGKKGIRDFLTFKDFEVWYNEQTKVCHYCQITEEECQQIIHHSSLTSKRFANGGDFSKRGKNRAYWLEIDRKEPNEKYSEGNCVLACYFCNNDKSDVFNESQYRSFKENRGKFLRDLIKKK